VIDHLPGRAKEEEQADVNVWDEPPDSPEKNIVKELNKNLKLEIQAGTLNKLIEQLVPDADKPLGMRVVRVCVCAVQFSRNTIRLRCSRIRTS